MFHYWELLPIAFAYLLLLFAIAYVGDRRAERGQSPLAHPTIYALAIAVYCTSWTFYGSVGRAVEGGFGFLPIYLGPTLAFAFGWVALKKMLRVAKAQRITSIADFIGARYGKSQALAALVTVVAVCGTVPYIALQLKAVAASIDVLLIDEAASTFFLADGALVVAAILAVFAVLFGARQIEATENHPGVAAAIAFESVVKLIAFLAVGVFVTYWLYDGFGDLFERAAAQPDLARLLDFDAAAPGWVSLTLLSAAAIFCLPRQFQVTIVGNTDERHLDTAIWLFPLYLFLINIFVLPIAIAGVLAFQNGPYDADTFVLALPMVEGAAWLTVFVFLGGLSAATAMVIVETIALSIMVSNDIVMPLLLRWYRDRLERVQDVTRLLLRVRQLAMVTVLLLGYAYFRVLDGSFGLVSIGLVAFVAAAQFAPLLLAAVFWRGGTCKGALTGLGAGFAVWLYTLFLPSLFGDAMQGGPLGLAFLDPHALFGLDGLSAIEHAFFWSMLVNIGGFVLVSLLDRPSTIETTQATLFVECLRPDERSIEVTATRVPLGDLRRLAERYVGIEPTRRALRAHAQERGLQFRPDTMVDRDTIQAVERLIAGAIGAASARVAIASAVRPQGETTDAILEVLDETSQVLEYSRRLEQKSIELVQASDHLRRANESLRELDKMKDEFLSTVTHELRTPLTAIRAFSELLYDEPDMDAEQRMEFLGHIIRESERLTRLVNQVLDVAKMEAGRMEWHMDRLDLGGVLADAAVSVRGLYRNKAVTLEVDRPPHPVMVDGDRDKLQQVIVNLLSNAQKFAPEGAGWVRLALTEQGDTVEVRVTDNGPGVPEAHREAIFERFFQSNQSETGNPTGTGLGLAICRMIVEHLKGCIWYEPAPNGGAVFAFTLPRAQETLQAAK
ncbi:MAG: histidine kinase [Geminicoccaceae bacterium]|nr:MAG: histidine kinase [Geminicoccaceae bacterium]